MRRRLLLPCLLISLASVLIVCIPLGLIAQSLIRDDFTHRLDRNLQNVASSLRTLTEQNRPITAAELNTLVPADRRVAYTPDHGPTLTAGDMHGAAQTATTALPTGRLQMQAPLSLLHQRELDIWLLIIGLGLLALLIATCLSLWTATRLSRPLQALAATAEKLGRGDLRPNPARYGITELDRLADVLDHSAVTLAGLINDERRFTRDASHQLRTPLASLSVRLDEIHHTTDQPAIAAEAAAALEQVQRLTDVVAGILRRRPRASTTTEPLDITEVLQTQLREWAPAYRRVHRNLTIDPAPGLQAHATPGGLDQALATLLDNALTHGAGATALTSRQLGSHITIEVTDQGPGIPEHLAQHIFIRDISSTTSTGLGLPLARSLIEADGGRLELTRHQPARFTVFLTAADPSDAAHAKN